jgi:hypothetical protein
MSSRTVRTSLAVLLGIFGGASGAGAQSLSIQLASGAAAPPASMSDSASAWRSMWAPPGDCVKSISRADMLPLPVYLDARMAGHTEEALTVQADLIAKDVVTELRVLLGGSDSLIPDAAPSIKRYSVPAELIVTARRDGQMSWRGISESGDSAAIALLSAALDSARRHNAAIMLWPDGYAADSLVVRLSLLPVDFEEAAGFDTLYPKHLRFRAFAMPYPTESPALPANDHQHIVYPRYSETHRVSGTLLVQFVVDTSGRVDMSTFRDLWPSNKPRLTGELGDYYTQFVAAVRDYAEKAKFTPARVGACKLRQMVQMPIEFVQPKRPGAYTH